MKISIFGDVIDVAKIYKISEITIEKDGKRVSFNIMFLNQIQHVVSMNVYEYDANKVYDGVGLSKPRSYEWYEEIKTKLVEDITNIRKALLQRWAQTSQEIEEIGHSPKQSIFFKRKSKRIYY